MTSGGVVDDEYLDDPITLIDYEQARINSITQNNDCSTTDTRHQKSSELMTCNTGSSYGKNHFILPVTFFDISSNLKLLSECRPVAIKVVDCDKHPWYYKKYTINRDDSAYAVLNNEERMEVNKVKTSNSIIFQRGQKMECFKIGDDKEMKMTLTKNNLSRIDFKRNVGLVGLKITPRKDFSMALSVCNSTNINKNTARDSIINKVDNYILGVDKALNDVGTTIVPLNNHKILKKKISQKPKTKTNFSKIKLMEKERRRKNKQLNKSKETNKNDSLMVSNVIPVTKSGSHVKDKTKTKKYMNDLTKKKLATENKNEPLDKKNSDGTNNITNECTLTPTGNPVENVDASSKSHSFTPINPGIKSPVLPCYKSLKLSFDKMKPKDTVTRCDSKSENCTVKEIHTNYTANIESEFKVNSDNINVTNDTNGIPLSKTNHNLTQQTLKDITISDVKSIPKNTPRATPTTGVNSVTIPTTRHDNAMSITVSTHKVSAKNNNIEQNMNKNKCVEGFNKTPGTNITKAYQDSPTTTKERFRYVPPNQRAVHRMNNYNSHTHPNIQTHGGYLNSVHPMAKFWPFWPPPPPPPPPPTPPSLDRLQENQPQSVQVIIGYGNNRKDGGGNLIPPNNFIASVNRELKDVPSSCKLPVEQVNSKSEMLKELDNEMMTIISNNIPIEDSAQKLTHVVNISEQVKVLPEKPLSNNIVIKSPNSLRHVRPGPKQFKYMNIQGQTNTNPIKMTSKPNLSFNYASQKTASESQKGNVVMSQEKKKSFNNTNNYINNHSGNSSSAKKNPYGYLIGTKVNTQHPKIAPIQSRVGSQSISSGPIGDKAPTETSKISKGYSPPILPIPSYEKSLEILYSGIPETKAQPSYQNHGKRINNIPIESFYLASDKRNLQSPASKVSRKRHLNNIMKSSKKISLEEYKVRAVKPSPEFQGTTDTLPYNYKSKCSRKHLNASKAVKSLSDIMNPISEQDLGYDSDSTVKI